MRGLIVCLLIFYLSSLQAQFGGDATFRFLELSATPRSLALADPITLLNNDIGTTMINPASIRSVHGGQLMVNYEPYFDGINRGTAAYAYTINRKKAVVFDVSYMHYGTFEGFDELGNSTANFTGNEVALGLASSHYFLQQDLHLGARIRYIRSALETYTSSGITADIGLFFQPAGATWRLALLYQHLGKQLTTYQYVVEPLPSNLTFGFSNSLRYLPLRWHVSFHHLNKWPLYFDNPEESTANLGGGSNQSSSGIIQKVLRHSTFGVEFFPDGVFSIRLGYHSQRAAEMRILDVRNFSGVSFGVGIQMRRLRFQLTHSRYSVAGNRMFFGLTIEPRE
jgi:hypothetical protein